ncbi:MAG TPA: hypothetical protein VJN91_03745, partial [Gammaproteobacteria bacterium]|nr:hypothetical protein [Gammaproteobacteria bacterium]
ATRFQWGVEYVEGLIRMHPHDGAVIAGTAAALLPELDSPRDALTGRNFGRLQTLLKAINGWWEGRSIDPDSGRILGDFYDELRGLCQSSESDSVTGHNCSVLQELQVRG